MMQFATNDEGDEHDVGRIAVAKNESIRYLSQTATNRI